MIKVSLVPSRRTIGGARRRAGRRGTGAVALAAVTAIGSAGAPGAAGAAGAPGVAADQASPSPWSVAAAIAGSGRPAGTLPSPGAGSPELAFAPSGRGVVAFAGDGLVIPVRPAPPAGRPSTLAAPITADRVGAATELIAERTTAVAAYGVGSLLAAVTPNGSRPLPAVAAGTIGGPLGAPRTLGASGDSIAGLVSNGRGDAAVLLAGCPAGGSAGGTCSGQRLALAVRTAGGAFTRPVILAGRANDTAPAVAIGPTGDMLLAWAAGSGAHNRIFARIRFAFGRVGPVQTVGTTLGEGHIAAVIGARDRAVLAWGAGYAGIDGATSPATFRVALAGLGGRFARAHTLDRWNVPGSRAGTAIAVVLTGTGQGLVAWQGRAGGHFTVDAARTTGSRVGAVQVASAPAADAGFDSLATRPGGAALALWSGPGGIGAAAAAPGQPFGAPEVVTDATDTYGASAALDPVSGAAVAVWLTSSAGDVRYSVRAAR